MDARSLAAVGPAGDAPLTAIAAPPATAPVAASPATATPFAAAAAPPAQEEAADGPRYWVGDRADPDDPNGQWALTAQAGSHYGGADYSAMRATGAPDVPGADDHPNAWCPAARDLGAHSRWKQIDAVRLIGATPR